MIRSRLAGSHIRWCVWTNTLSVILISLTPKTAKIIFKAKAHICVHADGVNALNNTIGVLGVLFSLNELPVLPRLNEV